MRGYNFAKVSLLVGLGFMAANVSALTWSNSSFTAQAGNFVAVFDAVPSQTGASEDSVIGLSNGVASQYSNLAVIARFNPSGVIDARNGSAYSSLATVPYKVGSSYHFRLEVNTSSHTYNVYVTDPAGTKTQLAKNYAFRSEQANVTQLNGRATGIAAGGVTVSNFALIPTTPALALSSASSSQINLSWSAAVPPSGYPIQSYAIFKGNTQIATVPGTQKTYSNTGLSASTVYSYAVQAIQANGNTSAQSPAVSAKTLAATSAPAPAPTPTPAPAPTPTPAPTSGGVAWSVPSPDITNFSRNTAQKINIDGHAFYTEAPNSTYSITNPDSQTLTFQVRSGDHYCDANWCDPTNDERAEVAGNDIYPAGTTINLNYQFMMAAGGLSTASNWFVIGQLHDYNITDSPPFEIDLDNSDHMSVGIGWLTAHKSSVTANPYESFTVNGQGGSYGLAYIDSKPIQRGHYYSMQISVKTDPTNGFLKVVRDGVQIVNYTGPLGFGASSFWKMGIYRGFSTKNDTQSASYRNFTISP